MSLDSPLVSIITPLYNTEKYISKTIKSILRQRYQNFEYIIIDDASTDNSKNVVLSFKDSRIRLIEHNENKGIIYTRNEAISLSKGKYIITLDSDDICHRKRIEKIIHFFDNHKSINVLASNTKTFLFHPFLNITDLPSNWLYGKNDLLLSKMIFKCPIIGATVSFRSSYVKRANPIYDDRFVHCEDFQMYQRELSKGHLGYLDEPLYYIRIRKNSDTSLGNKMVEKKLNSLKPIYREMFSRYKMDISKEELNIHLELSFVSFKRNNLEFTFSEKEHWCKTLCKYIMQSGLIGEKTIKTEAAYHLFQNALYHNCTNAFRYSYFSQFIELSNLDVLRNKLKTLAVMTIKKWYNR